jgi:AbrB family looped-hinge helix DNA binding protein
MKAIVSQKGQVTIPKGCRDKLGLRAGTTLEFEAIDGALVARKVRLEDVFRKWRGRGALPGGQDVDAYLAGIRE